LLAEGMAWGATTAVSNPQGSNGNVVSAPIPPKAAPPTAGLPTKLPGQSGLSNTASSNSNGTPSSCPLDLTTGPKGDIRDIRGPIHIPDPRLWLYYALGGILLFFLAWAAWKWFRKRQSFRAKGAFELAFEELEKAKALMTPEMAERFSVVVSGTIRTYIEKQFRMRATRKTTHEFITQVADEPSSELNQHSELLREFLAHCDLAKFARQAFSKEQMQKMHESAWRFVEQTKPKPEEKEVEKVASPVNKASMASDTTGSNISGRKRFFKGLLKDGLPWVPKKETGNPGFNNAHQVVTAGGR
jgi:hypothetical protein